MGNTAALQFKEASIRTNRVAAARLVESESRVLEASFELEQAVTSRNVNPSVSCASAIPRTQKVKITSQYLNDMLMAKEIPGKVWVV